MGVFIDTEIWSLAQKKPIKEKFPDEKSYEIALSAHEKAKEFISDMLRNYKIYMSFHQVCEIYHVLGFRGSKLPVSHVEKVINAILMSKRIVKIPVKLEHIRKSIELSIKSGIHIWDFLCVIPVAEFIDTAFSIDRHFLHPIFKELGINVENPLKIWITT